MSKSTTVTRGSVQHSAFLRDYDGPACDVATSMKVTPQALSMWTRGERRPDSVSRLKIERFADIPRDDWLTEAEMLDVLGVPK